MQKGQSMSKGFPHQVHTSRRWWQREKHNIQNLIKPQIEAARFISRVAKKYLQNAKKVSLPAPHKIERLFSFFLVDSKIVIDLHDPAEDSVPGDKEKVKEYLVSSRCCISGAFWFERSGADVLGMGMKDEEWCLERIADIGMS
jgi:hypothetical protein